LSQWHQWSPAALAIAVRHTSYNKEWYVEALMGDKHHWTNCWAVSGRLQHLHPTALLTALQRHHIFQWCARI